MSSIKDAPHNIYVYIMGSITDEFTKTNKISGYQRPTNGELIQNFVGSNQFSNSVAYIYAYGEKSDYETHRNTNNKCYYQLDRDNYYELDISKAPNILYFTSFKALLENIGNILMDETDSIVTFFLEDHGKIGHFASLHLLAFYQLMMSYPECKFLIFNDSCYSGSIINII